MELEGNILQEVLRTLEREVGCMWLRYIVNVFEIFKDYKKEHWGLTHMYSNVGQIMILSNRIKCKWSNIFEKYSWICEGYLLVSKIYILAYY